MRRGNLFGRRKGFHVSAVLVNHARRCHERVRVLFFLRQIRRNLSSSPKGFHVSVVIRTHVRPLTAETWKPSAAPKRFPRVCCAKRFPRLCRKKGFHVGHTGSPGQPLGIQEKQKRFPRLSQQRRGNLCGRTAGTWKPFRQNLRKSAKRFPRLCRIRKGFPGKHAMRHVETF